MALVTNAGVEDVIEIGRQNRPSLYDPWADRPAPLVPRRWRLGVAGRLAADGTELEGRGRCRPSGGRGRGGGVPVARRPGAGARRGGGGDVAGRRVGRDVLARGVARDPRVRADGHDGGERLPAAGVPVVPRAVGRVGAGRAGHDVGRRAGRRGPRPQRPAGLLLSGPAAGVRAAAAVAAANGFAGAISFDMGGTSTDVCLIDGGLPEPSPSLVVGGYPVRLPALAIHTIGAGGGSIAALDGGGALAVGPRSAGAEPGPACYGRDGTEPTVTDADLVLGRIDAGVAFPGIGRARRRRRPIGAGPGRRAGGRRGGGRRRRHGRGAAGGVGGTGRGPGGAGAGGVRRGGAAARLRAGRGAGNAGGDRAGPGRGVLGRRAAGRARAGGPGAVVAGAARPRRARRRPGRAGRHRHHRIATAPNRYRFGAPGHNRCGRAVRRAEPRTDRRFGGRLPRPPRPPQRLRPPRRPRRGRSPSAPGPPRPVPWR